MYISYAYIMLIQYENYIYDMVSSEQIKYMLQVLS